MKYDKITQTYNTLNHTILGLFYTPHFLVTPKMVTIYLNPVDTVQKMLVTKDHPVYTQFYQIVKYCYMYNIGYCITMYIPNI